MRLFGAILAGGLTMLSGALLPASSRAQDAFLTKADIDRQIIGKTFTSQTEKGKPMVASFTGSAANLLIDGQHKVSARLSFQGDTICLAVEGSAKECSKVRKVPEGYAFVDAATSKVHNVYRPR